jgi:U3 small nucleolar RNA-associated protein 14
MDEAPSEDIYRLDEMKRQEANSRIDKLKDFFPSTNKYSGSSGLVVLCDWSDLL